MCYIFRGNIIIPHVQVHLRKEMAGTHLEVIENIVVGRKIIVGS